MCQAQPEAQKGTWEQRGRREGEKGTKEEEGEREGQAAR